MNIKNLLQIKASYFDEVAKLQQEFEQKYDTQFFRKQTRLALRNVDVIDPCSIEQYIACNGYFGLHKALTELSPQSIIDIVMESGQRGRGGAGFPTGKKWQFVHDAKGDPKYIICNADEGDPGAFMDRAILEGDPHSVLEAMAIAGYATGANKGFIYVRAEYPKAVKNLEVAIKQAREHKLLGKKIFGTDFAFDIELRLGAGAYVCGEETALISSVEGKRGEPNPKPPYPAVSGLYKKPTLINNVETLTVIPMIILQGPQYFNRYGTQTSKGTKVFALAGNVVNGGLVEVVMGTTLRELIYDIGGGAPNDRTIKAVQVGGPSGGCIAAANFGLSLDYESVQQAGAILGSGGLIVMDDKTCMVDMSKFFIQFSIDESCGKCAPCRIGNRKLLNILEKISKGKANESQIEELIELSKVIMETSLCGLGQSSPNPVISMVTEFPDEFVAHCKGKCPAAVCNDLIHYVITKKCIGCGLCAKVCPVNAISGEPKKMYVVDQEKSIRCGKCAAVCPVNAIVKE